MASEEERSPRNSQPASGPSVSRQVSTARTSSPEVSLITLDSNIRLAVALLLNTWHTARIETVSPQSPSVSVRLVPYAAAGGGRLLKMTRIVRASLPAKRPGVSSENEGYSVSLYNRLNKPLTLYSLRYLGFHPSQIIHLEGKIERAEPHYPESAAISPPQARRQT